MERTIIGREKEKMELKKYIASDQSEFVAIYGQWRFGKIFLVKELFENQFTFRDGLAAPAKRFLLPLREQDAHDDQPFPEEKLPVLQVRRTALPEKYPIRDLAALHPERLCQTRETHFRTISKRIMRKR
jgi:hypothetical protein